MIFSRFLFVPLLAVFSACSVQAKVFLPTNVSLAQVAAAPKGFFWDLHDVVVISKKSDKIGAVLGGLHHAITGIGTIAGEKIASLFTGKKGSYLQALKAMKKLPKTASGDAYIELFESYGARDIAKLTAKIRNAYQPNKPVIDCIIELQKQGHNHYVASNIGPKGLPSLAEKMTSNYNNTIFSILNKGLVVSYNPAIPVPTCNVGANTYNVTTHYKPTDDYFIELRKLHCTDAQYTPIFIDDIRENVEAAVRQGFVGIWYNKKSKTAVAEFYNDLAQIGCGAAVKKA